MNAISQGKSIDFYSLKCLVLYNAKDLLQM